MIDIFYKSFEIIRILFKNEIINIFDIKLEEILNFFNFLYYPKVEEGMSRRIGIYIAEIADPSDNPKQIVRNLLY